MPPALGSKVSQDLATALLATFVYTSFALSCSHIFTHAVPSTLLSLLDVGYSNLHSSLNSRDF